MHKLLLLPLLVVSLNSFAGWEMLFCDSVDNKGNCNGKLETVMLSTSEVQLNVSLTNADGLHTSKVYFEIYLVDPATFAEDLLNTYEVNTTENAQGTSRSISFSKKGGYLIKARDSYKDYITSRELTVK